MSNITDVIITTPKWVSVRVISAVATNRRKAEITVAGLTRREFDSLPGKDKLERFPGSPIRWKKRVSAHLFVITEEPPSEAGVTK